MMGPARAPSTQWTLLAVASHFRDNLAWEKRQFGANRWSQFYRST